MTGDFTPDLMALLSADIVISTPEKWDGISRSWHSRSYVMKVKIPLLLISVSLKEKMMGRFVGICLVILLFVILNI